MRYVSLDGYIVRRATERAVGLIKSSAPMPGLAPIAWLPRGWCRNGDILEEGDTDIECFDERADEKNLDY